ncbi:hypothetical protein BHM03_00047668 [Ensete ventricosum]|nr:hypothetical protein BHM03_00047668 [Ensete ventricosum]
MYRSYRGPVRLVPYCTICRYACVKLCLQATISAEGRLPPRIGNVGHMTRIANKLMQLANSKHIIQTHLQVNQLPYICLLKDLLNEMMRYDTMVTDAYFDNESAEVISSLSLGDDQDSSQITNSNLFASENDRGVTDCSNDSLASSSPKSSVTSPHLDEPDKVVIGENKDPSDRETSLQVTDPGATSGESEATISENGPVDESREDTSNSIESKGDRPLGWIEWRETSRSDMPGVEPTADVPNGQLRMDKDMDEAAVDADEHWPSSVDADGQGREIGVLPGSTNIPAAKLPESSKGNPCEDLPEPLAFSTVENTGK